MLIATGAVRNLLREGKTAQVRNVITMGQRSLFPSQVANPVVLAAGPINARTTLATPL